MFKPLLRTLPSLSGNYTIGCKLDEIVKDSSNEYHTYVRKANIMPLQNNIYDKNIELNLLNGKYEHDVKKYHYAYSNIFYSENFSYNKNNYKELDLDNFYDSYNDSRNKDYELGCKRIKYSQSKFQFSFYAPFYLDDVNDLPEYFCINIRINKHLEKHIKVYIDKDFKYNYLKLYLNKYYKQVDDRVIFCLPDSLQATYFGIDVKQGGLVQYKDNEIGALYINQTTINNFDNIICKGFERNNLVMSQIFPISFMFNLNDIFDNYEVDFFEGITFNISGHYYNKNNVKYDFYDFDINYTNSYLKYNRYDENTGKYEYNFGEVNGNPINVMNVGYPALNEAKYIKYAYTNKITPNYCKFKMMLSSDADPYITNLNFGYSYLQTPNNKFGYFPTMFKGISPKAIIKNDDLKLPIGNSKKTYYEASQYYANKVFMDTTNIDKYTKLMTNYYSYWYSIENDNNNIFDDPEIWSDVKYNYAYYKGILYNFNELKKYNIDKFGVFLNFNFNYIDNDTLNNDILRAKCVLSKSENSGYIINNYNDTYNMSNTNKIEINGEENTYTSYGKIFDTTNTYNNELYVLYDKVMKRDIKGKYIKEENYILENTYYSYAEIEKYFRQDISDEEFFEKLENLSIKGYLLLDAVNNINYFETYLDSGNEYYRFMLKEEIFDTGNINSKYYWMYESLYYSDTRSTNKSRLSSLYNKISYDENIYGKFVIYLENKYIHLNDIYNLLIEKTQENINFEFNYMNLLSYINICQPYVYERYGERNNVIIKDYFIKREPSNTVVYTDTYNLNNLISLYNKQASYSKDINKINNVESKNKEVSKFVKFINKDHILEYFYKLNNDENNYSTIGFNSLLDSLYVKQRYWLIDNNIIEPKDIYVTLNEFIRKYPLTYDKKYKIKENSEDPNELTYEYRELLKYSKQYKNIYDNYTNTQILEWIIENLSDTRDNNNKFTFNLFGYKLNVDLCFKKEMILLDEELINFIKNDKDTINFLYLYINDSCQTENVDTWKIISLNQLKHYTYRDINDYLVPLYTSPYINDADINNELSMIYNNKIKVIDNNKEAKYIYNEGSYFKEVNVLDIIMPYIKYTDIKKTTDNIESQWTLYIENKILNNEIDKSEIELYQNFSNNIVNEENILEVNKFILLKTNFIYDNLNNEFYEVFKHIFNDNGLVFYSLYDILNVKYDNYILNDNITYDDKNKIYIYNDGETTYGFYYITLNIDNTNNSFNIINDYNINIYINSINGHNIKNCDKSYFNNIFYILQPLLKVDIFSEFIKNINTVVYPYEAEISIKYIQSKATKELSKQYIMLKDDYEDILYDKIVPLNDKKKIKLLRYFNYITPCLRRTSIIEDIWKLKFSNDKIYKDIKKINIFYKEDINIYKYDHLKIYNGIYDKSNNEYDHNETIDQYEYKHFNDSLMFNLPEEIIITDGIIYSEKDVEELNNNDNLIKDKKIQILLKYFRLKGFDYSNIILFLYNKYDSSIYIEKDKINSVNLERKYKISYKFKLI